MSKGTPEDVIRTIKFFLLALGHDSWMNHQKTNFILMHRFNHSMTELDKMLPYEREVFITLLLQHLEKQKQKAQQDG